MTEHQKNIIVRCAKECEACMKIAWRCWMQGERDQGNQFSAYAAEWSARAFEEVQA